MTDASAAPAPRRTYKIAGPQTWALARELYLSGLPAPEVAQRLGVSVHNLRKKATREGWSRRKHAEAVLDLRLPRIGGDRRSPSVGGAAAVGPELADDVEDAPATEADPLEAARTLLRRAAGAAVAGRLAQAGEAVKLAEGLARAAAALGLGEGGDEWDDDVEEEPRLSPEALEELREDVRRRYARFDRVEAQAAGAESAREFGRESGEGADAPGLVEGQALAPAVGAAERVAEPVRSPAQDRGPRGISRPTRAISAAPWPAWAGPADAWGIAAWRS